MSEQQPARTQDNPSQPDAAGPRLAAPAVPPLSARRRLAFHALLLGASLLTALGLGELGARLAGYEPWRPPHGAEFVVEGGKPLGRPHATLGHCYLPGRFVLTLPTGLRFRVTHDASGLRVTRPPGAPQRAGRANPLWIFGCSVTHGWSLDDEQTYPWLLQERLPEFEVVNFGVGGYGTLHSLLQFREALAARSPPRIAVLAYAAFHDARNTLTRNRLKGTIAPSRSGRLLVPAARLGARDEAEIFMADARYPEWPLQRRLALVHLLEQEYARREQQRARSHRLAKALLDEFRQLADRHAVRLVLAGIWPNPETADMLRYARNQGIPAVDISVPDARQFKNLPYDVHPNAVANWRYARKLLAFLESEGLVSQQAQPGAAKPTL